MRLKSLQSIRLLLCFVTLSLFANRVSAQAPYCDATYQQGCALAGGINDFVVNGESGTSINDVGSGCVAGTMPFGGSYYDDKTALSVSFNPGGTYSLSVSPYSSAPFPAPIDIQIWIDFDNSTTFDPGEDIGGGTMNATGSTTITLNIPLTATAGTYRMRACSSGGETYPGLDPCPVSTLSGGTAGIGETQDYTAVIVASGPTCSAPTVTLGSATCSTQVINWAAVSGATGGYEYVVNTTATSPTSAGTSTSALTYTATGLSTGTTYYAHVRTNCGTTGFSSWTNIPFSVGPSAIAGNNALCPGSTTPLSNSTPGGTWSSSNTGAATINPTTGLMGGVAAGSTTITYTVGGCTATLNVTVGTMPAITGTTSVCPGSTTTLANPVPGGTWSSSNTTVATVGLSTGVVYGNTAGTTVITYSASGCSATTTVTVTSLSPITGGNTVCVGLVLQLSNSVSGGSWTSSATGTATVDPATGAVTGVATGNVTITYTLGSCNVTQAVTVAPAISPISGTTKFCMTGTTTLSTSTTGGTWSSGNTAVATVGGTVTVYGVSAGTATISYTKGGCSATKEVTVDPNNGGTISGPDSVCKGIVHTITLTASQPGGTWSSSAPTKATVDPSTGVVGGVTAGSAFTITYTVTNTCGTYTVTKAMYVRTASKCATAIDPVAEQTNTLKVFPNPNKGLFTMNLLSDDNEQVQVLVTNLLGQKVSEFTTNTNSNSEVKLAPSPGIYLLTATTPHGRYVARIIVE